MILTSNTRALSLHPACNTFRRHNVCSDRSSHSSPENYSSREHNPSELAAVATNKDPSGFLPTTPPPPTVTINKGSLLY